MLSEAIEAVGDGDWKSGDSAYAVPVRLAACVRTTNRASSPFVMGEDQDGGVDGTVI